MKHKTRTKALSWLLSLTMALSLLPSISLTAYADTAGVLLTTITATAKEQASYSTANVATVSFSYTAGGSSAYLANWGWWGYGWTATVAPANGYTITKCVFYDDANRTATDSEAPFVVETTEEDKTPRINGTPIDGGNYQSKGLKKIEVYGYATPAAGNFTYTAPNHGFPTYDGTPKTATVVPKEGVTGMGNVTVKYYSDPELKTEVQNPTGAGEYYVGITVAKGDAYSAVSTVLHDTSWKFTIKKATPVADNFTYSAPSDLTYDGTAKEATVVGASGVGTVTVKYYSDAGCTTEVTPTDAGTYYVGIEVGEGTNYSATTSVLHGSDWQFTIGKATPTADDFNFTAPSNLSYDGTDKTATVTPSGLVDGMGEVTVKYYSDAECDTEVSPIDVGTYYVGITVAEGGNYEEASTALHSDDWRFTIAKADPTAPTGRTATYGQTLANVALPDGWTWADSTQSVGSVVSPAATFKANFAGDNNYNAASNVDVPVTVGKADSSVTTVPTANTLTYNGQAQELVAAGTPSGGTMEYSLDGSTWSTSIPTGTNAGSYTVYYRVKGDGNHNDLQNKDTQKVDVSIAKKALTVAADAKSKVYGAENPALTYTVTGLLGTDTLTGSLACDATTTSGVDNYAITQGTLANDNYEITYTGANLTVTQKEVGLEWANTSLSYTGSAQKPTATATGLVNGDTCEVTVSGEQIAVGTGYTATATALSDGNYKLPSDATTTFSIAATKAAIGTAPTGAAGLVYNKTAQTLITAGTSSDGTVVYSTTQDGAYSDARPTGIVAGSYDVWYKVNGDANHSDSDPVKLTVSIAKKSVTATVTAANKTYDGTDAATVTASVGAEQGLLDGDTITITGVTGTFADANVGTDKTVTVVSSEMVISGTGAANYEVSIPATATASISAYDIAKAKVYSIPTQYLSNGSATPKPVIRFNGGTLTEGTDYEISSYSNNEGIGTGTVIIAGKEPNFSGTTSIEFTIEKQAYPIEITSVALSTDTAGYGTTPTLNITKSSSVPGESIKYYYSSAPSGDTKTELDPSKPLNVGTWYIWAEITTKDYALAQTSRKVFTVSKAEQSAPDASVLPTQTNGYDVAVALPAGKTNMAYEYAITTGSEPTSSDWSTLPKLTNGKFTATGLNSGTTYTVWLRLKADGNHTASPSISTTLKTPADVMLSYDTNGGSGTVTAPKTYTSGATTDTIDSASGISRYGYTFDKWTTAQNGSGPAYTNGAAGFTIIANTTLYAKWKANSYTVAFDANGGTGDMSNESFTYGDAAKALTNNSFAQSGYTFAGWAKTATGEVAYQDGQSVSNLAASGTVTLYAVWVLNTYSINGTVKEEIDGTTDREVVGNVDIKLERGGTQFGATVKTDAYGQYTLSGVPAGTYNIVATRTLEDGVTTQTTTILVTVTSGDATANEIILPAAKVNSKLTVTGTDTPAVMVGELNEVAKDNAVENSEVTVTMTVEKKDESAADGADEIKELAATASSDNAEVEYLDVSMTKKVGDGAPTPMAQTSQVLELIIPFNLVGRNSFSILRHHAGVAAALSERYSPFASANAFEDGWFFVDRTNSRIYIYADQFSTYGIGYTPVVQSTITFDANGGTVTPASATTDAESGKLTSLPTPTRSGGYSFDGWFTAASGGTQVTTATEFNADTTIYAHWSYTGSGSGSGSGSSTSSMVTVVATKNGTVSHSPKNPSQGSKVTITAKPNVGYQVDVVTVKDASGKNLVVTDNGDGTFTYTQPSGKVTVEATFKEVVDSSADVLSSFTDVDATAWYADAIRWAVENGVMNGVGNNLFSPNGDTSRAMVVTMLWRMEGSPAYVGMSEFSDVENADWYGQAVRWANAEGIVEGYRDANGKGQMFNPNGAVTREQLAAILYRYAQYKKANVSVGEDTNILSYNDAFSVSGWATSAMQWAVGSDIINGIGSELVPAGNATRAQVATMLMRYTAINK